MKKIGIILLAITAFSCKAQQVIIPVEKHIEYQNNEIDFPNHVYLKDVNGLLNKYIGVWKKTQANKTYEFYVTKVTLESNDEYRQFKMDELEMRYKITDSSTGTIIVDTSTLTNSPYVISGIHFNLEKNDYTLDYIGLNDDCGQNGTVHIQVSQNNLNEMYLFLWVYGEMGDCPGGQAPQVLPTDTIKLIKQ